jgi:hypothetical protein
MPVANRDASELTRARRAMALYSYANTLKNLNGASVRREQPNTQLLNVYTEARQGGCYCAALAAGTYIFGGKGAPGGCGCGN